MIDLFSIGAAKKPKKINGVQLQHEPNVVSHKLPAPTEPTTEANTSVSVHAANMIHNELTHYTGDNSTVNEVKSHSLKTKIWTFKNDLKEYKTEEILY